MHIFYEQINWVNGNIEFYVNGNIIARKALQKARGWWSSPVAIPAIPCKQND